MKVLPIDTERLEAKVCRDNFYYFVKTFWDEVIYEEPVWNWHIEFICERLQYHVERVMEGKDKEADVVVNLPPGQSKSTICTIMLPVWCWLKAPHLRILTASYSGTLSQDHAMKSRDIIASDRFQRYFRIEMRKDLDNKTRYQNKEGGERFATSIGGTLTGFHAHLIVVDDPMNPKMASSEKERVSANRFMDTTLSTRKVNKATTLTIVVMQRLHQDDVTGHLLSKRNIEHICLPAELTDQVRPSHLKSKYIDGLMDVKRMPRQVLLDMKTDLGSYGYAGQMLQSPSPPEGGIWKKWLVPADDIPTLRNIGTEWDLAYTRNQRNSASAYIVSGYAQGKVYIIDAGYKFLEFPDLINFMKTLPEPHYIEGKASGKSAKQTLTSHGIPAIEVDVTDGDKISRTQLATPYAEAGMVYCKKELLDFIYNDESQGILKFPNAGTDLNDALVQAINRHLKKPKFTPRSSKVF